MTLTGVVCPDLVCHQRRACSGVRPAITCGFVFQTADGFAFTKDVLLVDRPQDPTSIGQFGPSGRTPNACVKLDDGG